MIVRNRFGVCLCATLLCATAMPGPAQAEALQGDAAVTQDDGFDAIVVTARRREESLQDVPASITAITAEALVEQGIRADSDLQFAAPGLLIRTLVNQNQLNYVIRGASLDQFSGSAPGVQPYINEAPISETGASSLYDLENVQILKGPQGTLFGRNVIGGAVLFQTAQPGDEIGGFLSAEYGRYRNFVLEGAISIPLGDKAGLRIAGTHKSGGAFVRNIYDGRRIGDQDTDSVRGTLAIEPTAGFTNATVVQYTHAGGENQPMDIISVVPCGQPSGDKTCLFNPATPAFLDLINSARGTYFPDYPNGPVFSGGLAALPAYLDSLGRYVVSQNAYKGQFQHDFDHFYVTNTSELELGDNLSLKNIFSYSRSKGEDGFDNDSSPYPYFEQGGGAPGGGDLFETATRQFTNEVQLQGSSADQRLTYIIGGFYLDRKAEYNSPISGVALIPPNLIFPFALRYHAHTGNTSLAVFGQVNYAITDRMNLTAGLRWSWDKLTNRQGEGSAFGVGQPQSDKENDPSWTVSVDYKLTPDLLGYITTRGSWRVGGFNSFAPPVPGTAAVGGNFFAPEKVRDVEAGLKFSGRVAGTPVRANVSGYYQWNRDIQKTAYVVINGTGASATVNVPTARIYGFEGDFQIAPTEYFDLGGQIAYTNAKFKDNETILFGLPAVFGPYGDVPKVSGSAFVKLSMPLGEVGTLALRGDVYAQSPFWVTNLGRTLLPNTKVGGYALINARLDWKDPMGIEGLTASVIGKNLTNKFYYTGGSGAALFNSTNYGTYGRPRTWAVSLRQAF